MHRCRMWTRAWSGRYSSGNAGALARYRNRTYTSSSRVWAVFLARRRVTAWDHHGVDEALACTAVVQLDEIAPEPLVLLAVGVSYPVEIAYPFDDLVGRRHVRTRCGALEVDDPSACLPVALEVWYVEDHRLARHGEVESQRGVVDDGGVGGEVEVGNLRVVGDVDDARSLPNVLARARVERVAAYK